MDGMGGAVKNISCTVTGAVRLADVPMVLRADLYAVAALAGASIVVIGTMLGLPTAAVMAAGAVACFDVRMLSAWLGWQLPVAADRRPDTTPDLRKVFGSGCSTSSQLQLPQAPP